MIVKEGKLQNGRPWRVETKKPHLCDFERFYLNFEANDGSSLEWTYSFPLEGEALSAVKFFDKIIAPISEARKIRNMRGE